MAILRGIETELLRCEAANWPRRTEEAASEHSGARHRSLPQPSSCDQQPRSFPFSARGFSIDASTPHTPRIRKPRRQLLLLQPSSHHLVGMRPNSMPSSHLRLYLNGCTLIVINVPLLWRNKALYQLQKRSLSYRWQLRIRSRLATTSRFTSTAGLHNSQLPPPGSIRQKIGHTDVLSDS